MYTELLPSGRYRHQITFIEERTGKKRKVSTTTDKNTDRARREAEQALQARIREINGAVDASDLRLDRLCEYFLEARRPFWRIATLRRYEFSLKAIKTALGADSLVDKLTAHYVQQQFAASGKNPTTLNEMLRSFKTLMTWAYRNDYISSAEWLRKLERYPEPTAREKNVGKFLERDELAVLLPELKVDVNRYLITFLALSGLRVGEALALTKADVDLNARLIHVTKTRDAVTGEVQDGAKTYMSNRSVYIQDELLTLCKEINRYMKRMSMACGFRSDLFFSDFDGRPLQYDTLNKYFRENCERVLKRRLTLHSLRHTHASLMFEGGASLDAVSLRLGHADSRITKEIYLHVTERLREQYNATFDGIKILS